MISKKDGLILNITNLYRIINPLSIENEESSFLEFTVNQELKINLKGS
jgi:hypothetical protein